MHERSEKSCVSIAGRLPILTQIKEHGKKDPKKRTKTKKGGEKEDGRMTAGRATRERVICWKFEKEKLDDLVQQDTMLKTLAE